HRRSRGVAVHLLRPRQVFRRRSVYVPHGIADRANFRSGTVFAGLAHRSFVASRFAGPAAAKWSGSHTNSPARTLMPTCDRSNQRDFASEGFRSHALSSTFAFATRAR